MATAAGRVEAGERSQPLKERILAAAAVEFAELGYHRSSLRSISARSHATKPMIYYHFSGKDGLYAAAIGEQLKDLEERLRNDLANAGTAVARLRAFAQIYASCFMFDNPGLAVALRELPALPSPLVVEIATLHARAVVSILRRILRDGVSGGEFRPLDTDNCARAIVGILHYYIRGTELQEQAAVEAATAQVSEYYAAGLRADRSDSAAVFCGNAIE